MIVIIQSLFSIKGSSIRVEIGNSTDKRIKLMNEIIIGIKVIKMYTWENPFIKLIEKLRKNEINSLRKATLCRYFSLSFHILYQPLMIATIILLGIGLNLKTNWPLTSFFRVFAYLQVLQIYCGFYLPYSIFEFHTSIKSLKRIQVNLININNFSLIFFKIFFVIQKKKGIFTRSKFI